MLTYVTGLPDASVRDGHADEDGFNGLNASHSLASTSTDFMGAPDEN